MLTNPKRLAGYDISDEFLVKIKEAVTACQKQTKVVKQHVLDSRERSFRVGADYKTDDVNEFIEETRNRKTKDGQLFSKQAQMHDLIIVGERVCTVLLEAAREDDVWRPLM